jgi:putative transposase
VPFWNTRDLQRKLNSFKDFYNHHRCHHALKGDQPAVKAGNARTAIVDLHSYRWKSHCRGLYHLPVAA